MLSRLHPNLKSRTPKGNTITDTVVPGSRFPSPKVLSPLFAELSNGKVREMLLYRRRERDQTTTATSSFHLTLWHSQKQDSFGTRKGQSLWCQGMLPDASSAEPMHVCRTWTSKHPEDTVNCEPRGGGGQPQCIPRTSAADTVQHPGPHFITESELSRDVEKHPQRGWVTVPERG